MDVNKILSADFLDILFEGRNKEYGAYELRKTYNRRFTIAIAVMIGVCVLAFLLNVLASNKTEKDNGPIVIQDVQLQNVQEEKKPEPPPPPPPPKVEPPKIEIKQFTPPKIVKDEEVKEPPPKQEELEKTTIGTINQEGVQTDVIAPPVEEKGTGVVEAPKVTEDYDKEFKTVQIQAKFPGGPDAWMKYLQRNLQSDVPTENGAPTGSYTVVVSFLVDKDGNISEVKAENDPGYGTAGEAVRVISRGPKWIPAVQNGRNVIYRQKQAITFRVEEGQ
ncbi:energy transducer TonB [Ilyomonas limi]|uniref:Energy transducer TonB n=1 Tax=Ilyomonas limi TaxID=2575867 RepID=A0A4U3L0Z5_9BACT|nr:energy transducer TonB [Ilyomonas limi]TKK68645.1 energy transducer TonB [Ilyomonas limi]